MNKALGGRRTLSGMLLLLYHIGKRMPLLTCVWLFVPIGIGMLVIPLMLSQKQMIDKAVTGLAWGTSTIDEMLPVLFLFGGTITVQVIAESLRKIVDETMNHRAAAYIQAEIFTISTTVPLERFEHSEFYDRLHQAHQAAGQDLIGMLRNGIDSVQRLAALAAMVIVVSQGHWLLGCILLAMNGLSLYFRLKIEIAKRKWDKQATTDGRLSQYWMKQLSDPGTLKETKLFDSTGYFIRLWSTSTLNQRSGRFAMSRKGKQVRVLGIACTYYGSFRLRCRLDPPGGTGWIDSRVGCHCFSNGTPIARNCNKTYLALEQAGYASWQSGGSFCLFE
ncbi:hypothetical protein [Paenibacillus sp. 32352]|uniref:hypothetical protein n=1 Tax=Paenibacillus sp. 32352 TaxID=1969111 RepID=UPI0009AD2542|nr:hypothetical protein [Paenibacillus sp. 32352]